MSVNEKMTAIADAIRGKTGTTELLTLDDMPTMIEGISTGGDIPEENFTLTGDCNYMFYGPNWAWYIEKFGDRINTVDMTNAEYMFGANTVEVIPFDFNFKDSQHYVSSMFYGSKVKDIQGKLVNMRPFSMNAMFMNCYNLRYLPEFENLDLTLLGQLNRFYGFQDLFSECTSLRYISPLLLNQLYTPGVVSEAPYDSGYIFSSFTNLFSLDELIGLNPMNCPSNSNMFSGFCFHACRCKEVQFMKNEDGTPIEAYWANQIIDLSRCVGWAGIDDLILGFNSGITEDKKVYDDDSYNKLRLNAEWYTTDPAYSRYNHDSAVKTIDTLPDVNQGSGNTIKFKGEAGLLTNEGAINTMTEEELAPAVAKGWTVAYS